MRVRRVAVFIMLAVGLVVSPTATVGAEAPQKAPPGFKTVKIKSAGFSIAIPKDWTILNITSKNIEKIVDNAREVAPGVVAQLPDIDDLLAQNMVLIALSDETSSDFRPNVNVLVQPEVTSPATPEGLLAEIRTIAEPGVGITLTTIDGEDAVRATYRLDADAIELQVTQHFVTGARGGLTVTFTGVNGDDSFDEDFDAMADSIKLLKR